MIAFGPVPSRRLGRSLGINNIPAKICTYSCAYCQVGRTLQMEAMRRSFFSPQELCDEVEEKVKSSIDLGLAVDYLTFVPDGEPTLDINLGQEIERQLPARGQNPPERRGGPAADGAPALLLRPVQRLPQQPRRGDAIQQRDAAAGQA